MSNLAYVAQDSISTWSKIWVAALAVTAAPTETHWPSRAPVRYTITDNNPSYSAIAEQIKSSISDLNSGSFAGRISEFYASLLKGQEPLGLEFESVWDANVDKLYES